MWKWFRKFSAWLYWRQRRIKIPAPKVSPRFDLIIVEHIPGKRQRIKRIEGIEGYPAPQPTQVTGVVWQVPIALVRVEPSGWVEVVDSRK